MKKPLLKSVLMAIAILFFIVAPASQASSQTSELYTPGSVWEVTFVKLKPHSGEQYLEGLKKTWKSSMDELVKANLIKSYKILWGEASNEKDFDMLLMVEHANFAAFDPDPVRDKKIDEIEKKIKDALGDDYLKTVEGYTNLRELLGTKVMREISIK